MSKKVLLDEVWGFTNKNFTTERSFNEHIKIHKEEQFKCNECPDEWTCGPENIFETKKKLADHKYAHHTKYVQYVKKNLILIII